MGLLPLFVFLLLCAGHHSFTAVLGENTDSRNLFIERACCRRQSHVIYIGKDISGSPVRVDVGVCRTHCGQSARSTSYEAGLKAFKYSSMLDFLRHKKLRHLDPSSSSSSSSSSGPISGPPSCGLSSSCEPAGVRVDRVMLYEGLREVEIIEDCHCEAKMSQCVRAPSLKTYHSETSYETVIDAGKCVGSKGAPEGFSCVPTKFDSTLIETPNKVELVQTVAQCKLMEGCYRIPYLEYHYEISYDDGVQVENLREIDVGRCLGSCTSGAVVFSGVHQISGNVCCGLKDRAMLVFLNTTRATLSSVNTTKSALFWPSLPVYASLKHIAAYWTTSAMMLNSVGKNLTICAVQMSGLGLCIKERQFKGMMQ